MEAFETARSALATDGPMLFAFTSEVMPPARGRRARKKCKGWSIQSSGRFCHTKEYLYALAKQTGFTVLHYERIVPRMEAGKPIQVLYPRNLPGTPPTTESLRHLAVDHTRN